MEIDPNWFYSSIAQCSAAIVGIMGAFLTTRILNQKQLISSIQSVINDKQGKIDFLKKLIRPKKEYIDKIDEEDDLDDAKDFLKGIEEEIDLEKPLSVEELYDLNESRSEEDNFQSISKEALKKVYPSFLEDLSKKRKSAFNFQFINTNYSKLDAVIDNAKWDRYNKFSDEISSMELEISSLEHEIFLKNNQIENLKRGLPLFNTLLILFGFSLIGVFLPLALLLFDLEKMLIWRTKVFFIVLTGWIGLVTFFLIEINNTKKLK